MKKLRLFPLCFLLLCGNAYGYDIKGLQPIAPNGVFSTFSAESTEKGKVAFGVEAEKSREPDYNRYTLKSAYGLTGKMEFLATLSYIADWRNVNSGYEDFALGLKHRFFNEGTYGPSVAYIINASASSGEHDFGTEGRLGAGLIVSKRVGPVTGHANILYEKAGSGKPQDEVDFAVGFDFSASHSFKILAEIYGRKYPYSDGLSQLEGRFGYRFITTDYLFTTIGAGFDLKNRAPEFRIMLSVGAILPAEKKVIKKIYEEEK